MAKKERTLLQPHAEQDSALPAETIQRQVERVIEGLHKSGLSIE
jgi:hypothetical protein